MPYRVQLGELNEQGIIDLLDANGIDPTEEEIAVQQRLIDDLNSGVVTIGPQTAALVGESGEAGEAIQEQLFERVWSIWPTSRILITSDDPVVPIGGPGHARDERAGFASAAIVIFPICPDRLLVMMRPDFASAHRIDGSFVCSLGPLLDHIDTFEVCREIAMHAHRWTFERPKKRLAVSLKVPNRTDVMEIDRNLQYNDPQNSQLLRFSSPTRWRNARSLPDWPVPQWWSRP